MCVGVLRLLVRLVTSGQGLVWRPEVMVCWVTGLGGGAAGWGVRRVLPSLLEGLLQAPEDIRVVLGRGEVAGMDSRGWSTSASMASYAACGIHPLAGWGPQFSTNPLRGRWTRPSREGSARAHLRSFQSFVWVQRCHHCPWAGPRSWAEE